MFFTKNGLLNWYYLINFCFENIRQFFDIENWLWKYGTFWQTLIHCRIIFKQFPLSMLILGQKSCILGPTIYKIHNQTEIIFTQVLIASMSKVQLICLNKEWENMEIEHCLKLNRKKPYKSWTLFCLIQQVWIQNLSILDGDFFNLTQYVEQDSRKVESRGKNIY